MTGLEVITGALEELGILAPGETANPDDVAFGLRKLNRMLLSWSADGINLHIRVHETFPLVYADPDYTIGASGADITSTRPNVIEQAFIRDASNHDHLVWVRPIAEYWSITEKSTISRPKRLFYDPTYPNGTIYVRPTPDTAETMHIVSQKPMATLTGDNAENTEIVLPGEYGMALAGKLAMSMASAYGKMTSAELRDEAATSYGALRALNLAGQMKPAAMRLPGQRTVYHIDEG